MDINTIERKVGILEGIGIRLGKLVNKMTVKTFIIVVSSFVLLIFGISGLVVGFYKGVSNKKC